MKSLVSWQIQSRAISWLRFPLAVLVVAIHTPCSLNSPCIHFTDNIFVALYVGLVYGICQIAVPAFFLFSGYFFFSHFDTIKDWGAKLKKRSASLFVPYIVWNILAFFFLVVVDALVNGTELNAIGLLSERGWLRIFWDSNLVGESQVKGLLGYVMHRGGPSDGPLWFIRDLMVLMLFSPFIKYLIDIFKDYGIIIISVLMVFDIWFPFDIFTSTAFCFFTLGGFFQRNNRLMVSDKTIVRGTIIALSIVSYILMMLLFHQNDTLYGIFHQIFCLFGSFTILYLACWLIAGFKKIQEKQVDTSFFIFAFHTVGPIFLAHNILEVLPDSFRQSDMGGVLCWIFTVILAVAIMEGVYFILLKYAPSILKILSGNRV